MNCSYPPSPYGLEVGEVLGGHLAWQGFPAYAAEAGTVDIGGYHDCDGSKGLGAVLFMTVTASCIECVQHLKLLEGQMQDWASSGIRVVALVGTGAQGPATVTDAEAWKSAADLDAVAVVADPNLTLVLSTDVGYPNQVLVDPRTMQVVERRVGYDGDHTTLEGLAASNAP